MVFRNIGFLGCGNMGGALAGACAKRTKHILLANRTPAKAEALAAELSCQAADNRDVAERCDLIFLGVKPQMMGSPSGRARPGAECPAGSFCAGQYGGGADDWNHPRHGRGQLPGDPHHA